MQNQPLLIAGGSLLIGVMLAVAVSESRAKSRVSAALERAQESSAATLAETTESMNARIDALEASLGESAATVNASIEEKLAVLQEDVGSRIDAVADAATSQAQEWEAALSALSSTQDGDTSAMQNDATSDLQTSDVLGVGQTAIFADGAVRAFVSAMDLDTSTAKLSVNGAGMSVGIGETAAVEGADCVVGIASLDAEGVTVASDCGMSVTAEAADVPPAPDKGFKPGGLAILADGALRVFVSGLADDGSSARIAINGVETQTVAAGTSIEVSVGEQTCQLAVTGVGNGMVGMDGNCS